MMLLMHYSIKSILLSWHGSFVGKKRKSMEGRSFVPILGVIEGKKQ